MFELDPRVKFDFGIDRFNCGIDPGAFSSFISIMFGFLFIWCVLSLWLYGLTLFDWCVFVCSRKRKDAFRHAFPYADLF